MDTWTYHPSKKQIGYSLNITKQGGEVFFEHKEFLNTARSATTKLVAGSDIIPVKLSKLLIIGLFRRISCINVSVSKYWQNMTTYTYIIKYKEFGREWSSTSYSSPEPVTKEYLIDFFGLEECEDYLIEEKH